LKEAFDDLERAKRAKTEIEKVEILLDGMKDRAADVVYAVNTVRSSDKFRLDFMAATDFLKQTIERVYPAKSTRSARRVASLKSKANNGNKKQTKVNGVDVSDWNREFSQDEWAKLPGGLKKKIATSPGRAQIKPPTDTGAGDGARSRNQKKSKLANWKAKISDMKSTDRVEISAGALKTLINGESYSDSEDGSAAKSDRHVLEVKSNTQGSSNGTSPRKRLKGTVRFIDKMVSGPRREVMSYKSSEPVNRDGTVAQTEIDNHADTCCLGKNFRLLTYTNHVCTVNGFLDGMEECDVPIVSAATLWTSPDGDEYILVVHQGLWFGDKLNKSLLNPNQLRFHGVSVSDDPTDDSRAFGLTTIHGEPNVHVPFYMDGTIAAFETRCPSDEEVEELPQIEITGEDSWDPTSTLFPNHQKDKVLHRRTRDDGTVIHLAQSTSRNVGTPTYVDKLSVCDEVYAMGILYDRLVNTSMSSSRHHAVSKEELSRKWAISLTTAERTLQATTQHCVRSAKAPLAKRYRPGKLLLRDVQRLKSSFYTDTFKGSTTSLIGNKYGQLFAGSKVIYVDSCKRKSDCKIRCDSCYLQHVIMYRYI